MSTLEQQPNSDSQTLEAEVALTKQEIEEFRKLPKEERRKHRDEKLVKLKDLQVKLDQAIQEAVRTGRTEEASWLKDQIEKEVTDLESLLTPNPEKLNIPFDPNNIFLENDWVALQNLAFNGDSLNRDYIFPNSCLAIIDRKRVPDIFPSKMQQIMSSLDKGDPQSIAWWMYAFPEYKISSDLVIQKAVEKTEENLLSYKSGNNWRHVLEEAAWLTIMGRKPEFNGDDFAKIETEFKSKLDSTGDPSMDLIEEAAAMSIIYPDYLYEISKEKGEKMVLFLKEWITQRRDGEWYMFAAMAKIVADKLREIEANKELD